MENTLLNLVPASYLPEVHLSQYDVGRELKFTLKDGSSDYSVPSGAVVTVKATKPSGLGFVVNAVADGNIVTLSNTETMTNENGRFPAELSITQGSTVIGTSNFIFNIERSPHPEGTIDGDAESLLPELTLLVERIEAAADSVHNLTVEGVELAPGSTPTVSYNSAENKITFGLVPGEDGEVLNEDFMPIKLETIGVGNNKPFEIPLFWEQGGINNRGEEVSVPLRIRSKGITKLSKGTSVTVTSLSGYEYTIEYYNEDGNWQRVDASWRSGEYSFEQLYEGGIRIMIRKPDDSAITPTEGSNLSVIATSILTRKIDTMENGGYELVDLTTTDGGYINQTNGEVIAYNNWKYTDFVDVSDSANGKVVIIMLRRNGSETLDGTSYNAWYDENKTYLYPLTVINNEIEIPVGAKYLRLSNRSEYYFVLKKYSLGLKGLIEGEIDSDNEYLKVMTWNVGIFNDGTTRPTSAEAPEKIALLKRTVGKMDADVFNAQEYATYVDSDAEYPSADLLKFKYHNKIGGNGSATFGFSKLVIKNVEQKTFASGSNRPYWVYEIEFGNKTITVIDVHLSIELDPTTYREDDIAELITFMNTKDRVILTGDFNISSDAELEPFKTAGYTLCNGGDFGWFDTWPVFDNMPEGWSTGWPCYHLDNIIVSSNITPQYVEAVSSKLSDHAPLYAELKIE